MTITAAARPVAGAALDLDARLALRLADMTSRLDEAAVAFEVNTAHITGADPIPEIAPQPLTPTAAPNRYTTPIAGLLRRARIRIETDGWLQGARRDEQGARCPDGAIRYEASSRYEAIDALTVLLEAIQNDFPDAETVPSWNDTQTSPAPVLLALGRAAELADNRGI